jgi:hypothetical protein
VNNQNNDTSQPTNRLVALRWFDNGTCPEELIETAKQLVNSISTAMTERGNAVDVKITPIHGIIDLDQGLFPILTSNQFASEHIFAKAAFSLADMDTDSGDKLFCLREFILWIQKHWALPGFYIGLSMHVVRQIASLAYWKNWALEFRLDKRGDAFVMAAHFPNLPEIDFVINIFRENDPEFNPYPLMKEWLWFFRSIVQEVAKLWTIRIIVNESIAEKIGCLDADDVVITNEQMPQYPYL